MTAESIHHMHQCRILVRGAGDFATGIIHRLHSSGFQVFATELEKPLAVRRGATLSEAVYEGTHTVEGVTAERCTMATADNVIKADHVPLLIDTDGSVLAHGFDIVVDARSAKQNIDTTIDDAPIVIAIGPGFMAGKDCHAVVETLPGAGLGRVIIDGAAAPDTGVPTPFEMDVPCASAFGIEDIDDLVFRAPATGRFTLKKDIGSPVSKGEVLGWIETGSGAKKAIPAKANGLVRGVIRDGTPVEEGVKLGDIDPTGIKDHCYAISEKARAIAGGVLEACLSLLVKHSRKGA